MLHVNSAKKQHGSGGFTLAEMLIVAPIIILALAGIVMAIVALTGSALVSRGQSKLTFDTQSALNQIADDIRVSDAPLAINSFVLNSGQHSGDVTTSYQNVSAAYTRLILSQSGTTTNPRSPNAEFVYKADSPAACTSAEVTGNDRLPVNIVYFVENGTLWRRTLVQPGYASTGTWCKTAWQRPSCAPGYTNAFCKVNDEALLQNIDTLAFDVEYLDASGAPIAEATNASATAAVRSEAVAKAKSVKVKLSATKLVSSKDVTYAASVVGAPQSPTLACPNGFIPVPGNPSFGTSDFCVMKYEAKQDAEGNIVSVPEGLPLENVTQTDALRLSKGVCDGCHLITEAEWMTIANNAMYVGSNYTSGTVSTSGFMIGHTDNSPSSLLTAGPDSDPYYGTNQTTGTQRRTLNLSNGQVIWDLSGNTWEWTQGTIMNQAGVLANTSATWNDYSNPNLVWGGLEPRSRPHGGIRARTTGFGGIYSSPTAFNGETHGMLRGGRYISNNNAGIYSLNLAAKPNDTSYGTGFRVTR